MLRLLKLLYELTDYNSPLRPPGALPEKEFKEKCISCNKCAHVCPYDSIKTGHFEFGHTGTPKIYPRDIPCYVCMKCPPVCPTGALDNNVVIKEKVKMGVAKINEDTCLPYMGVICRACFENCPIFREAIYLEDEINPKVDENKCIGCGICEHVCPVEGPAIVIESSHII